MLEPTPGDREGWAVYMDWLIERGLITAADLSQAEADCRSADRMLTARSAMARRRDGLPARRTYAPTDAEFRYRAARRAVRLMKEVGDDRHRWSRREAERQPNE